MIVKSYLISLALVAQDLSATGCVKVSYLWKLPTPMVYVCSDTIFAFEGMQGEIIRSQNQKMDGDLDTVRMNGKNFLVRKVGEKKFQIEKRYLFGLFKTETPLQPVKEGIREVWEMKNRNYWFLFWNEGYRTGVHPDTSASDRERTEMASWVYRNYTLPPEDFVKEFRRRLGDVRNPEGIRVKLKGLQEALSQYVLEFSPIRLDSTATNLLNEQSFKEMEEIFMERPVSYVQGAGEGLPDTTIWNLGFRLDKDLHVTIRKPACPSCESNGYTFTHGTIKSHSNEIEVKEAFVKQVWME